MRITHFTRRAPRRAPAGGRRGGVRPGVAGGKEEGMGRFQHHVFICENERPPDDPRGCCACKGSEAVRAAPAAADADEIRGLLRTVRRGGNSLLN